VSEKPVRMAVAGASGRMGQTVIRAIEDTNGYVLAAALVRGQDWRETAVSGAADVVVDFSTPEATLALLGQSVEAGTPHVIGTTGFSAAQAEEIAAAAQRIPIVKSANMSVGICLLAALVKRAAATLTGFDIEVLEMHHRNKLDAPSGTALLLGEAAAEGRQHSRFAGGTERDIGFASLRGGTVVGEHTVIFAGPQERLALAHSAEDRIIFARGALVAAGWIIGRPPGLYSMADVLNLN